MGGKSTSQSANSSEQSGTTNPWAPAIAPLQGILSQIGSGTPSDAQSAAASNLQSAAANIPNFGPQAAGVANSLLSGGIDRTGLVSGANNSYQGNLSPYLASNYTDPTQNPQLAKVLETIRNDVGNNINSQFAGAGRDLSGINQQTLARGISQGEAQPLLNQYNTNVGVQRGAQDASYGANMGTASALSGLDQTALNNRLLGAQFGTTGVPQAYMAPAQAQYDAANNAHDLQLRNLGLLSALTVPIAGLGGQTTSQGSGTSNTTNQMSGAQQFALIANGLGSMFAPRKA